MHELIREYGESITAAIAVIAVVSLFCLLFLSPAGALHDIMVSYCGWLL